MNVYKLLKKYYTLLLNAYYKACKVSENLAKERNKKYNMPREFHEWKNIITMRLEIAEKYLIKVIDISSSETGYEYDSLIVSLGDCLYKILNKLYDESLIEISLKGSIPHKKYKHENTIEWRLDLD